MNRNGQLILETLGILKKPVSIETLVSHIAVTNQLDPSDIQHTIKQTLNGGVRLGYLQCKDNKFFAAPVNASDTPNFGSEVEIVEPVDVDEVSDSDEVIELSDEENDGESDGEPTELVDGGGRRRAGRKRGGRQRRRRTGSRIRTSRRRRRLYY